MIFDPKIVPKTTQDWPKTDPRGSSKPFFFHTDFCVRFCSVLGSILDPLGEPFGPQNRSQIAPDFFLKLHCGSILPRDRFKRPQDHPKRPQDPPKRSQDRPKRLPRPSQKAPRGTQALPRPLQATPRMPQEALRGIQDDQTLTKLFDKFADQLNQQLSE